MTHAQDTYTSQILPGLSHFSAPIWISYATSLETGGQLPQITSGKIGIGTLLSHILFALHW